MNLQKDQKGDFYCDQKEIFERDLIRNLGNN